MKLYFFIIILFLAVHGVAQPYATNNLQELSKKEYWTKLLHYQNGRSVIQTKDFFLSQNGNHNPQAELKTTLKAFQNTPETRCKYPARYKWLVSQGVLHSTPLQCTKLDTFLEANFTKISLLYATARYSESASLFGHVFLRLDGKYSSKIIEYTAKIPKGTNIFSYIGRGLFGGFTSKYNFFSYFSKDHEARDEESRDLIVYRLNYTKEEIRNILLHLYEIKDTTQKYYFTSHNCASELLVLMDMADYNGKDREKSQFYTLPIEVISDAYKNSRVKNVKIVHSLLKEFTLRYERLIAREKNLLKKVVSNKRSVYSLLHDRSLSKSSKDKIVLSALSYFNIKMQRKRVSRKILSKYVALSQYQTQTPLLSSYKEELVDKNPLSSKLHKIGFGYLYKNRSYLTLNGRYLYKNRFDLLDKIMQNGSVELFNLMMRVNKTISLDHFTLLHLASLPISNAFFLEPTKELRVGIKRFFYEDKLYKYGEYALGIRGQEAKNIFYALSLSGGLYNQKETRFGVGFKSELEYKAVAKYDIRVGANIFKYMSHKDRDTINATSAFINYYLRSSKRSLYGIKLQYNNDIDSYIVGSFSYNYSF